MQQVSTFHPPVRPIRRGKLSDQVVQRIEQMIVDGSLAKGTLLPPERELMRLFGVGRPSVREALFAFGRMGYVLVTIAGNPIFTAVHDAMVDWLTHQRRLALRSEGCVALALDGHRNIFEAVAARDAAGAERAMSDHLEDIARLIKAESSRPTSIDARPTKASGGKRGGLGSPKAMALAKGVGVNG